MLVIPVDISFLFAVFSECRFSVPAPESHHSVAPLAPIGEVVAESYPIRTVIQFSICPSIGRQREGSFINPLNNQLGTFLPFARKNFCKFFVNGSCNGKKSRYTAHQISGKKSLAISLMKLCTGSEIQKPSMSAFSATLADSATGAAQPQSLSAAALCFTQIFSCGSLMRACRLYHIERLFVNLFRYIVTGMRVVILNAKGQAPYFRGASSLPHLFFYTTNHDKPQ